MLWLDRIVLAVVLAAGASWALAQDCHDWDGDHSPAGWECATHEDCEDRSWRRHPGAFEICDGLDNDCDGLIDQTCDRYCDEVFLVPGLTELPVEGLPQTEAACMARTETGFLVVSERIVGNTGDPHDSLLYARAFDGDGVAWGPSSPIGEPVTESPYERRCRIAVAGERALVVYQDGHSRDQGAYRLKANVVDSLGQPVLSAPVDLSATSPLNEDAPWMFHAAVWDGERFAVFWAPSGSFYGRHLLMSVLDRFGVPEEPATVIVTDNVDGDNGPIYDLEAVWTGEHFVVVLEVGRVGDVPDIFALTVGRDGTLLKNELIDADASGIDLALGEARIGIFLQSRSSTTTEWRMAFLDFNGNYLDPPGVVEVRSDPETPYQGNHWISWTGQMFVVSFSPWEQPMSVLRYRWYSARVLPDGTVLDAGAVLLADDSTLKGLQALSWSGRDLDLITIRGSDRLFLETVARSCDDDDGDLFNACGQSDCDDTDPAVNPLAAEICRGMKDDNCNGLADCDDVASCPGGLGPPPVTGLSWNGSQVQWDAVAGAERYDLARGTLSDLRRRGDLLSGDCAGVELDGTVWVDDGRIPPVGEGLWYLVRPEGEPCELGSWGEGAFARDVLACR